MLHYGNRQAVTRIMKVYSALNFRVKQQSSDLLHTEVEGTKVLSNFRNYKPNDATSHPTWLEFSALLQKPQTSHTETRPHCTSYVQYVATRCPDPMRLPPGSEWDVGTHLLI